MASTNLSDFSSTTCTICSGPSDGYFFGVLACRACSAFFRRSARDKRQYACRRRDGKCQIHIDGMRNSCRSCRMRRCFEVGMAFDSIPNNKDSNSIDEDSSRDNQSLNPSNSRMKMTSPLPVNVALHHLKYPNSSQIAQSLRNLANAHRALISLLDGSNWIKVPTHHQQTRFRLLKINDLLQMDRGNISLMLGLIREFFPQFDTLDTKRKVRILKNYYFHVGSFYDSDMTIRVFSGTDIRNFVVWYTECVIDKDNLEEYYGDMADVNERIQTLMPIYDKWLNFIWNRLAPLELDLFEFNALVGLQLFNCIECVVPLSPEMSANRDQFFVELQKMCAIRENSDQARAAIRFGKLLQLLQEVATLVWEFEEICNFCRIFYPPVPEWLDDVECHKKLGLE